MTGNRNISKQNLKKNIYSMLSKFINISYFHYINCLNSVKKKEGVNILDLGCGNGHLISSLSEMFPNFNFIGVDIVQNNEQSQNIRMIKEDIIYYLESNDMNIFSLIIMNDVIEHFCFNDIEKVLNILINRMKYNSILYLQFPNMSSPFGLRNFYGDPTHLSALSDKKLEKLLSKYNDIKIRFIGVEEIPHMAPWSFLLGLIYWKFLIKLNKLFLINSIGWNKFFFYPNLLCEIQKIEK